MLKEFQENLSVLDDKISKIKVFKDEENKKKNQVVNTVNNALEYWNREEQNNVKLDFKIEMLMKDLKQLRVKQSKKRVENETLHEQKKCMQMESKSLLCQIKAKKDIIFQVGQHVINKQRVYKNYQ